MCDNLREKSGIREECESENVYIIRKHADLDQALNYEKLYQRLINIINIKITNFDNVTNRHHTCSRDKCLRRNDGAICMTCKYMFPKDLCFNSKIVLKF